MNYAKSKLTNKLVVITGPSAAGKDVVANEISKWLPLKKVVTTTTRAPRPGEKRGVAHHFVSRERFKEMIKQDLLLEYVDFDNNYYGTRRQDLRRPTMEGLVPLLRVDPIEALRIQRHNPDALVIFIRPESIQIIKKRLMERGTSVEDIDKRLRLAKEAMTKENIFAYSVVNRDGHLEETVRAVKRIVKNYLGL
ncbi:guanylate kinase [Patescibacteria group bacterium]|nr:guanylate kinase [Patescibacteria group bacterium]